MESFNLETVCPKCGYGKLKLWSDLSEDERMIARRVLGAADFSVSELKLMTFCIRCWDAGFWRKGTLA